MNELLAITIDYERWHLVPDGATINWESDIFKPTATVLDICSQNGVKLTFMVEMGEYLRILEHYPEIAKRR